MSTRPFSSARSQRRAMLVLAGLFLALHLPFMASTLGDIDTVNLALGVREFDPARNQPHPPGYPIYTALGRLTARLLDSPRHMVIWGVLSGAWCAFLLHWLFRMLGDITGRASPAAPPPGADRVGPGAIAVAAAWMTLCAPLIWFGAARPLTGVVGLAAVTLTQAVLATALVRRLPVDGGSGVLGARAQASYLPLVSAGAFLSALAVGVRSQAGWLTLPLVAYVLVRGRGRLRASALAGTAAWFAAGALLWLVPLLVASGGPSAYLDALGSQASDDWNFADILVTRPTIRKLAWALVDTFIRPWDSWWVGGVVVGLAALGALGLLWRARATLQVLLAMVVPYLVFHLLFQETAHTRYATSLVPVVAFLAANGLAWFGRRALIIGTSAVVVLSLINTQPKLVAYSREGSPAARVLADLTRRHAEGLPQPAPMLRTPHALSVAWRGEQVPYDRVPTLLTRQWSALVDHWRDGNQAPVWFMAAPEASGYDSRHNLAHFDPTSRTIIQRYRWPFDPTNLLGGARPSNLDWYELRPPGWMVLDGWSLTPPMGGLTAAGGHGPARTGAEALVLRRSMPVAVLVGGRNLGSPGSPAVRFTLTLDGTVRDSWVVDTSPGFFLRTWIWNDGVAPGPGPYASLVVRADSGDGRTADVQAAVEQFDLQTAGEPLLGFGEGWHEREYDPRRGLLWRWASRRATLVAPGVARAVALRVVGEAPSRYFDRPSEVVVRAGTRVLFTAAVSEDFDWRIPVTADDLASSDGHIAIETSQAFTPAERGENADRRVLGLRIFHVSLEPAGKSVATATR